MEHRFFRLPAREVLVGEIGVGGNNPIRVQSMVNTDPADISGTIDQIIKLRNAGCEIVRITVPTVKIARNLHLIRDGLRKKDITIPIVADVHFNPEIAEISAEYVEKVRINPGNYGIFGKSNIIADDEESYNLALKRTNKQLVKLIEVCRNNDTAIRIGSNHGSLSKRILYRYGDTPDGMVESVLEFVRIFHENNYHKLILSLKSSNVKVMINAYRLLVRKMLKEGFNYPLHLGVTEAGVGMEGAIRSAAGIGALLEEGIGDTIRFSLSGNPIEEIPFAKTLSERYNRINVNYYNQDNYKSQLCQLKTKTKNTGTEIYGVGGENPPVVIGYPTNDKNNKPDILVDPNSRYDYSNSGEKLANVNGINRHFIVISFEQFKETIERYKNEAVMIILPEEADQRTVEILKEASKAVLIISASVRSTSWKIRSWIDILEENKVLSPRILRIKAKRVKEVEVLLYCTALASGQLVDRQLDGLWIISELSPKIVNHLSFQILQATRSRIINNEYISCPTCGRTKFDVRKRLLEVKNKTSHLTGLKIAVMGCVVNGPGEMADADYGYVGRADKSINLYKKSKIVRRGVPEEFAVDALIECIKKNGEWRDP